MTRTKKLSKAIFFLSILGAIISLYLVKLHYTKELNTFCNFGDYWNCDVVNRSIYSEILGVPVSILGAFAYSLIALISFLKYKNFDFKTIYNKLDNKVINKFLVIFSAISFGFSLGLTYIELFILYAICIFCLAQQTLIFIIFIISILLYKKAKLEEII
jgi:uncharacterized membrane protein